MVVMDGKARNGRKKNDTRKEEKEQFLKIYLEKNRHFFSNYR